jgi:hypothetical protein
MVCGRHSDVVEEYLTNKQTNKQKRRKRRKIRNYSVQKYEFLFAMFCTSVKTFQQMKVCEKSQVSFDPKSHFNEIGNL